MSWYFDNIWGVGVFLWWHRNVVVPCLQTEGCDFSYHYSSGSDIAFEGFTKQNHNDELHCRRRKKRPKSKVAPRKIIRAAHTAFLTSRQQNRWKVGRRPDLPGSYNSWVQLHVAMAKQWQDQVKTMAQQWQTKSKTDEKLAKGQTCKPWVQAAACLANIRHIKKSKQANNQTKGQN